MSETAQPDVPDAPVDQETDSEPDDISLEEVSESENQESEDSDTSNS